MYKYNYLYIFTAVTLLILSTNACSFDTDNNRAYGETLTNSNTIVPPPIDEPNVDEPDDPIIIEPDATEVYTYSCTTAYIDDQGYGPYNIDGGCQNGSASMEMTDHKGTAYEAHDNCNSRGMRLPTFHELSAAANFAYQLQLSQGNYWASPATIPSYTQNCFMPVGNCGQHNPEDIQYYRCVSK